MIIIIEGVEWLSCQINDRGPKSYGSVVGVTDWAVPGGKEGQRGHWGDWAGIRLIPNW